MAKATGPPNLLGGEEAVFWDADDLSLGVATAVTTVTIFLALCGPVIDIKSKDEDDYNRAIAWSFGWTFAVTAALAGLLLTWLPVIWWLVSMSAIYSMYEWTRREAV